MELGGLHHVTAVTADAPGNLDFYTRVLGLRLVKKTVNQDDVSAYHLFYADAEGHPGSDLTFFPWSELPPGRRGTGPGAARRARGTVPVQSSSRVRDGLRAAPDPGGARNDASDGDLMTAAGQCTTVARACGQPEAIA